jgi:hypothetical protein
MRLKDVIFNNRKLHELAPAIGAVAGGVVKGAQAVGGAIGSGAQAVGQATSGLAGGGMNPAQAAQAAKQRQDQKKQIQDAIKQKQQELSDLQKQLAQIG